MHAGFLEYAMLSFIANLCSRYDIFFLKKNSLQRTDVDIQFGLDEQYAKKYIKKIVISYTFQWNWAPIYIREPFLAQLNAVKEQIKRREKYKLLLSPSLNNLTFVVVL